MEKPSGSAMMSRTFIKAGAVTGDLPTKAYRAAFEEREANIMKQVRLWAVGIGVLMSVGLLTVEQGFAAENDGAPKCTLATLKGRYLFGGGTATIFPPAFGVTEVSIGAAAGF